MNRDMAARFMGCRSIDVSTEALLEKAEAIVLRAAEPKHRIVRISKAAFPLEGRDAARLTEDCMELCVLCATLGSGIDLAIRKESLMAPALGLAVNATAAAYLEEYLDALPLPLSAGEYPTPRYSPGYGDMPLSCQTAFLTVTEARRIGLCETAMHMLTPEKSVTAVLGITHTPQKACVRHCDACTNLTCPFRG